MHEIHAFPLDGLREPVNSLSHAIGACVFTALAFVLVYRGRGDRMRMLSLAVMAYATIQTLVLSSFYHMFWPGPMREFMLRADVAGIFLLIAGSLTPIHAILFEGSIRSAPLIFAWTVAIGGMLLRIIYFDRLPNVAGTMIFLVLGWGMAITAYLVWRRFGWKFVRSGVMAGLSYTVGAIILMLHRPMVIRGIIGPHELWHFSVLCAMGFHWKFVFQFAGGLRPEMEIRRTHGIVPIAPPHLLRFEQPISSNLAVGELETNESVVRRAS